MSQLRETKEATLIKTTASLIVGSLPLTTTLLLITTLMLTIWCMRTPSYVSFVIYKHIYIGTIKNKLKQYMQAQDITLQTLFKLIDTNSDSQLSATEFKLKLKALQTPLDESEMQQLFQLLDKSGKGIIDY